MLSTVFKFSLSTSETHSVARALIIFILKSAIYFNRRKSIIGLQNRENHCIYLISAAGNTLSQYMYLVVIAFLYNKLVSIEFYLTNGAYIRRKFAAKLLCRVGTQNRLQTAAHHCNIHCRLHCTSF